MSRVQYITKSIARTGIGGRGFDLDRLLDTPGFPGDLLLMLVAIEPKIVHEVVRY
jgi:hypothetical protein